MKKIVSIMLLFKLSFALTINPYYFDISEKGIGKKRGTFTVISPFDFRDCWITTDINHLDNLSYSSCRIHKKRNRLLICSDDNLDNARCIYRKDFKKLALKLLNQNGYWYVNNVAYDDTLSLRKGPSVKFSKIYKIPPYAKYIKVFAIKKMGKSYWAKIDYQNHFGWVNSKFLRYKQTKNFY